MATNKVSHTISHGQVSLILTVDRITEPKAADRVGIVAKSTRKSGWISVWTTQVVLYKVSQHRRTLTHRIFLSQLLESKLLIEVCIRLALHTIRSAFLLTQHHLEQVCRTDRIALGHLSVPVGIVGSLARSL